MDTPSASYRHFLRKHRQLLGFCLLINFCSCIGLTSYLSLFNGHLQREFSLSASQLGGLFAAATLLSGAALPWMGALIDRLRLTQFSALCFAGLATSCLLMAWMPVVWLLLPAYCGVRLCARGLMDNLVRTTTGRYFGAQRGRAAGFGGLGRPLGQMLLPLIAVFAMQSWGLDWRSVWLGVAGMIALWWLLAHLLLGAEGEGGYRSLHAAHLQRMAAGEGDVTDGDSQRQWRRGEVLRDWRFHALLVSVLAVPFIFTGVLFNQVWLVEQKGWALEEWALAFISCALLGAAVAPLAGIAVDRIGPIRWLGWALLPIAMGLALFPFVDHIIGAHLLLGLMGLTGGMMMPVSAAAWAGLYGTRHLGAINAMVSSALMFATAAAPLVFGLAVDLGAGVGVVMLLGLVPLGLAWPLRRGVLRGS